MDRTLLRRITVPAASLAATAVMLSGCAVSVSSGDTDPDTAPSPEPLSATPTPSPSPTPSEPTSSAPAVEETSTGDEPAAGTALEVLGTLSVKGRAPMTGYDRDQFGSEWSDAAGDFDWSRNGCDTRNDVLARDLQREVVESNGCVVTSGVLAYEPYTGVRNYYFDKHDDEYATDLDVEHVVALGNGWVTGAQQWSEDKRAAFANDPINIMLTDPSENRSKGDADAATWLPPNKAFRCSYIARQIAVKHTYALAVTAPEKAAMERVLATCPNEPVDQPAPQDGYTASEPDRKPATEPKPAPKPSNSSSDGGSSGEGAVYYENCDAARADGAAPVRRGDPGYGSHLDRDGDGSACE